MPGLLERLRDAFAAAPRPIPDALWEQVVVRVELVREREASAQARLRELAARFLARKRYSPVQGMELDDIRCLIIAVQACLPALELGFDALGGWREVIVYPGEFRVRREHHDDHTGVVTEGDDVLIGEAWEHGPLILSWADIEEDLAHPHDGLNVIVHEIAHKLDMRSGAADGVPPLPAHIARRDWIQTFQQAFDAHCRAVAGRRRPQTVIDPYAAEAPDEFFAVVSEMHFSSPQLLAQAAPGVARLLRAFYDGAAA
jgi:Mlc titration factor MtfA (ptsG expression regulator)